MPVPPSLSHSWRDDILCKSLNPLAILNGTTRRRSIPTRSHVWMASEELAVKSFTSVGLPRRGDLTETGTTSPVRAATVLL